MMNTVCTLLLFFALSLHAQEKSDPSPHIETKTKEQRLFGVFSPGFASTSAPTGTISGPKIGMEGGYAIKPKWSLGIGIEHGLSGLSSVFTSINIKAQYYISGSFYIKTLESKIDQKKIVSISDLKPSGLRASFGYSQLFFNGTIDIIAFSGFTAGLLYDWDSNTNLQYGAGLSFGYHSNGVTTITPIQAFMRLVLWL